MRSPQAWTERDLWGLNPSYHRGAYDLQASGVGWDPVGRDQSCRRSVQWPAAAVGWAMLYRGSWSLPCPHSHYHLSELGNKRKKKKMTGHFQLASQNPKDYTFPTGSVPCLWFLWHGHLEPPPTSKWPKRTQVRTQHVILFIYLSCPLTASFMYSERMKVKRNYPVSLFVCLFVCLFFDNFIHAYHIFWEGGAERSTASFPTQLWKSFYLMMEATPKQHRQYFVRLMEDHWINCMATFYFPGI